MFKNNLFFEKQKNYESLERICLLMLSKIKKIDKIKDKKSLLVKIDFKKTHIGETGIYIKNKFIKTYRFNFFLSVDDNDYFNRRDNFINTYIDIKESDLSSSDVEIIKTKIIAQNLNAIDPLSMERALNIANFFIKKRKIRCFGFTLEIEKNENIIKKNKLYKKALKAKSYIKLIPSIESKLEIEYEFLNNKVKKEIQIKSKYPKTNKHYNFGMIFPVGINPFVDNFENKKFFMMMYNRILIKEVGLELSEQDFKNFKECSKKINQITEIQKY